jgi:hypothetical protein
MPFLLQPRAQHILRRLTVIFFYSSAQLFFWDHSVITLFRFRKKVASDRVAARGGRAAVRLAAAAPQPSTPLITPLFRGNSLLYSPGTVLGLRSAEGAPLDFDFRAHLWFSSRGDEGAAESGIAHLWQRC